MYDHPFFITGKQGNNAFSFEKRVNPTLFVPNLIEGGLEDVTIGDQVVFEDFDDNGQLKSCVGLKHFVRMKHPTTGKPIVIVDNHNHVFYSWHKAREKGWIKDGATLIHIDQHKDMRKPPLGLDRGDNKNLQKIFEYTNSVLNVGNYILPAIEDGLVGKVISVTSEKELDEWTPVGTCHGMFPQGKPTSIILNIDLDFWAPEMDYIDRQLKNRVARAWMERADFITIATSPFFINQMLAIDILRELLEPKDL